MKDALIIFIVGLFVIIVTIIAINKVKEYKQHQKKTKVEFVCKEGGMPDWNCFPAANNKL